jgi:hypothetical protein
VNTRGTSGNIIIFHTRKSFDEILQKMKMALKVYLFKSLGFICRCSFSDHGRWWRAYKKTVISFQFSIPGDREI